MEGDEQYVRSAGQPQSWHFVQYTGIEGIVACGSSDKVARNEALRLHIMQIARSTWKVVGDAYIVVSSAPGVTSW